MNSGKSQLLRDLVTVATGYVMVPAKVDIWEDKPKSSPYGGNNNLVSQVWV
jgi:hypothetical protein